MSQIIISSASSKLNVFKLGTNFIKNKITQENIKNYKHIGKDFDHVTIQNSSYGIAIPILYGNMRVSGNVIWALPIRKESKITEETSGGRGKFYTGNTKTTISTQYYYYATFAVALCEGEINEIKRIWIDNEEVSLNQINYRLHNGSEDQLPDSLIQASLGIDNTPAYRGIAYIVIENLLINNYGNRIPNLSFEVAKYNNNDDQLENKIESIVMIPGSGEFVYDTQIQHKFFTENANGKFIYKGKGERINSHNNLNKSNAVVATDNLKATCPNVKWISVVVGWFATSLDIANCSIFPGVEYKGNAYNSPDDWKVANYNRYNAYQILTIGNKINYGGTINDNSLIRYLNYLKNLGYKIMLYPVVFVDTNGKPWRGHITGSANEVSSFFNKDKGYNEMIIHYANITKSLVDCFVIGSELKALTSIKDSNNNFPAIGELINLAKSVRNNIDSKTKITYAADWSEYHSVNGWYYMDDLWASEYIDIIGIDAYFPLLNSKNNDYNEQLIRAGWESGEGYDWFYSDRNNLIKENIDPAYAWKNIKWWWENDHVNPDNKKTAWNPKSKKIWFTEFGFPSVDNCASQPNVFYDYSSYDSNFPYLSSGNVDFLAQRKAINATIDYWHNSEMVENMFLWSWDARPYPYWPSLSTIWSDYKSWKTGHWVQGKLGISSLSHILSDLCKRAGLNENQYDVSEINKIVDGFIISKQDNIIDILSLLSMTYFFDIVESNGRIKFVDKLNSISTNISLESIVGQVEYYYNSKNNFPKIYLHYINKTLDYLQDVEYDIQPNISNEDSVNISIPIVLSSQYAKLLAKSLLYQQYSTKNHCKFTLNRDYYNLECSDIFTFQDSNISYRITDIEYFSNGNINISAVAENQSLYFIENNIIVNDDINYINNSNMINSYIFELPILEKDSDNIPYIYIANNAPLDDWQGISVYQIEDNEYKLITNSETETTIGKINNDLPVGNESFFDYSYDLEVILQSGSLTTYDSKYILNGKNLLLINDEIIQFKTAEMIADNKYILSGLLRARLGTKQAIHNASSNVILINSIDTRIAMLEKDIGKNLQFKVVANGGDVESQPIINYNFLGKAFKTYSPVHVRTNNINDDEIKISWIRRERFNAGIKNNVEIPLNESFEKYQVLILQNNKIIHQAESLTNFYIYKKSELNINSDNIIEYKINQISPIIGVYSHLS